MTTPLDAQVSVFPSGTNATPAETLPLTAVLQRIQDGTYQQRIEALRAYLAMEDGKRWYDDGKKTLPAFTPAGVFTRRANARLTEASGLVHFDFDHPPNLAEARATLAQDPWIAYAFISPSGDGLKVAVWADGIVDDTTYKHAWGTVLDYFERTYPDLAVANDKACKDIARLCFVSHDPELYGNPDALLYAVPRYQAPAPKPKSTRTARPQAQSIGAGEQARVEDALRYIQADCDYDTWFRVGAGLHASGEPWARAVWDTWSASCPEKYHAADQETTWNSLTPGGGVNLATVFHLAQQHGYAPARPSMTVGRQQHSAASPAPANMTPAAGGSGATAQQWGTPGQQIPQPSWESQLLLSAKKIPLENFSNLLLILENHDDWTDKFWFDAVRAQPMLGDVPIDDGILVEIARWFGLTIGMPLYYIRRLENCVRTVCQKKPRDLLQEWLQALPTWDGVERLTEWLSDVASVDKTTYSMELSRLIPVSMVARALNPGCQYRYVIILEGAEDSGKSKLVRTLASPPWYREFAVSMDNKEAHMLLQGAWVAELGELASLSRTEEAKLKSFVTLEEDVWIPKYSNFAQHAPRRTIFLGTVNPEDAYLRGQTGNTRFLPIKTGDIDCADLEAIRDQLFAEALIYYQKHQGDWWQLSADADRDAQDQREQRRQSSVFETDLADWLDTRRFQQDPTCIPGETAWAEIAQHYLMIDREKWKDRALQMQIAQALRANGWESVQDRQRGTKQRYWRKKVPQPVPTI